METENTNTIAPHEKTVMPRSAGSVSKAVELIKPLVGKIFHNKKLNIEGALSERSLKKLREGGAVQKSVSPRLHAIAVANIDVLFENADFKIGHPDRNNDRNIRRVHRLGALMFDDVTRKYIPIKLTVKEFSDGNINRIYSIEALDIEMVRGTDAPRTERRNSAGRTEVRADGSQEESGSLPNTEFNNKIIDLLEKVNSESNKSSKTASYVS